MYNDFKKKIDIKLILICTLIEVVVSMIAILFCSFLLVATETDYKYSPVYGSISVALGAFAAAFYLASKVKNRGYICGLIVGGVTFVIVTITGLIANEGGITVNTLFHLIIFMLTALSGGVLGVNKRKRKLY